MTTSKVNSHYSDPFKLEKAISFLSYICTAVQKNGPFANFETNLLCLRCIVGSILITNKMSPKGVYCKSLDVLVAEAVKIVVHFTPIQSQLENFLRYRSKHLGDPTTIPAVKALLA
jgi:hypothetical protein